MVVAGLILASQPHLARLQVDSITGTRQVTRSWLFSHSTTLTWTSPLDAVVYSRRPELSGRHWITVWENSHTPWQVSHGVGGGYGACLSFPIYEPDELDRLTAKLLAAIDRGASRSELEEISQTDKPSS